ncbi:hypothetical protein ACOME3_009834 [Neoechinorhynchus agilis]
MVKSTEFLCRLESSYKEPMKSIESDVSLDIKSYGCQYWSYKSKYRADVSKHENWKHKERPMDVINMRLDPQSPIPKSDPRPKRRTLKCLKLLCDVCDKFEIEAHDGVVQILPEFEARATIDDYILERHRQSSQIRRKQLQIQSISTSAPDNQLYRIALLESETILVMLFAIIRPMLLLKLIEFALDFDEFDLTDDVFPIYNHRYILKCILK